MRPRLLLALLLASCTEREQPPSVPSPSWVYEPRLPVWQTGKPRGRFGRSQAPQLAATGGIVGEPKVPLRAIATWSVPGEPARAVAYGFEGAVPAIELIEIDRGRVLWRHPACVEPVIAVTASTIVCGGVKGVRGVGVDGQPKWKTEQALIAVTGDRVVVASDPDAVVLGADDGRERARVTPPAGTRHVTVVASCDGELFAFERDKLARIADARGKPAIAWQTSLAASAPAGGAPRTPPRPTVGVEQVDCAGDPILVETRDQASQARSLVAIARTNGKIVGRIDGMRGWWRARDGSDHLEVSTSSGIDRWPRDLSTAGGLNLPPLGPLLDARGDRRLVRATPFTAVVLDARGIRAYVPLASRTAALGDAAIVGIAAGDLSLGGALRLPLPPPPARPVRVPPRRAGVALPAELRDLPDATPLGGTEIAKPDTAHAGVLAIALDPVEPAALYAVAVEEPPTTTTTSPVVRADLATRAWTWQRSDGCGPGVPRGLALARGIVVCASHGTEATVRATSRDGKARWDWLGDQVDEIFAAGDAVLVFAANRLTVLDADTGRVRGRLASPDGAPVRATVLEVGTAGTSRDATEARGPLDTPAPPPAGRTTWLVVYERGRLVARLPSASMIAVWSLAVDGVVSAIMPSGDGVLVTLDDGDAYRVDLATAAATSLPGLNLAWQASDELITGETVGGPIPGVPLAQPARPRLPFAPGQPAKPLFDGRNPDAPTLWIPVPQPAPIGWSWQYTLYERDGGLRARNDYGIATPVARRRVRGPSGSPLVIVSGADYRDVMVVDPTTGDPVKRVLLPEGAPGLAFGTIVDGKPVAGAVLAAPLRIVLF